MNTKIQAFRVKTKKRIRKSMKGNSHWVEENQENIVVKVKRRQYFKKEGVVDSGEDY